MEQPQSNDYRQIGKTIEKYSGELDLSVCVSNQEFIERQERLQAELKEREVQYVHRAGFQHLCRQ